MIPLYDDQPATRPPVVTIAIILLNIAVFAGWQLRLGLEESVQIGALVPAELVHHEAGAVTRLITSMFMHGGWMHLIGNMWFLWIFGNNVEDACGHFKFICFYLAAGALASLAYVYVSQDSTTPLVGASGAISGVLGAYLLKHPRAMVRTLVPLGFFSRIIDIPAFLFLLIWIGFQVLSQAVSHGQGGGVAYLAHIGGFVAGMILIFIFQDPATN
jgi:membrane associated rhomboid family serine protease